MKCETSVDRLPLILDCLDKFSTTSDKYHRHFVIQTGAFEIQMKCETSVDRLPLILDCLDKFSTTSDKYHCHFVIQTGVSKFADIIVQKNTYRQGQRTQLRISFAFDRTQQVDRGRIIIAKEVTKPTFRVFALVQSECFRKFYPGLINLGPVPQRKDNSIPDINVPYSRDNFNPGITS